MYPTVGCTSASVLLFCQVIVLKIIIINKDLGYSITNAKQPIPTYTSNKNIHFEMILDVGIGEKRKETRILI